MRNFVKNASVAAVGIGLVLGAAVAASNDEQAPEARAYFGLSFGGEKALPRDLHYGLRVDQDRRFGGTDLPPIIQLDYTTRGLNDLRVNGLSAVRQSYRLRQAEEEEIADEFANEPGFFESIGNWFGGLFGGDEAAEEAAEETADAAEEAPPEDVPTDGAFLGYNAIDWGLVAVGAVGLGFAATEAVDAEDTTISGGGTDGGDGGDGGGGGENCIDFPPPIGRQCAPTMQGLNQYGLSGVRTDPQYQEWLDGGTGQMGDLGGAD